jgi:uncharacterized protein with PIN domain
MRRCPECGEPLSEHSPFDPELVRRGLLGRWRVVYTCRICGYLEWEQSSGRERPSKAWSARPAH